MRLGRWLPLATFLVIAAMLTSCTGYDGPATAAVEGLEYEVGVARSLEIEAADVIPHGEVTNYTDPGGLPFADSAAYALSGIDPADVLVVRWAPGLTDDAGSLGEWALLYRVSLSEVAGLCAYFDPTSDASPPHCR